MQAGLFSMIYFIKAFIILLHPIDRGIFMESLHAPYNVSDWIDILKIPCVLDNKRRKVRSYQLLIFSALFCVAIKKYKNISRFVILIENYYNDSKA